MNQELKKCPCCGGNARLYQNYNKGIDSFFVNVRCENCGTQSKFFSCKENVAMSNWNNIACKNAIDSWNNRKPIEDLSKKILMLDKAGCKAINISWILNKINEF